MAGLHTAKKDLRKLIRNALSQVSRDTIRDQSSNVYRTLLTLPEYVSASRISIYLSMPTGEISTEPIVHDALDRGMSVFVPYLRTVESSSGHGSSSTMDMLRLRSKKDFESLTPDKWGIPTLGNETVAGRENAFGGQGVLQNDGECNGGLDVILMPGMAFDTEMGRIGHGKGYYDFFLDRYQETLKTRRQDSGHKSMPFLVGLALKEQLLPDGDHVPTDSTDWILDRIVLGDGRLLKKEAL